MGDWLFGPYRNLVVSLLVRTDRDPTPIGRSDDDSWTPLLD